MLVLSRKQNQRVVFPNLGISVEILKIAGNSVRVGVDAPTDVRILRDELANSKSPRDGDRQRPQSQHEARNRWNSATLGLHLAQMQLRVGKVEEAQESLNSAIEALSKLEQSLTEPSRGEIVANSCAEAREPSSRRALIVEDSPNERELLAGYLRLSGYDVDTVEDGLAAMAYLARNDRPDVVLLDIHMPRMDGGKTVSAIRGRPEYEGLKIFAVSGGNRSANPMRRDAGFDGWFSKPLNPQQFVKRLDRELTPMPA